ncbi:MAG: hypothetical protein RL367_363 [Pseudomonadota bacterium]
MTRIALRRGIELGDYLNADDIASGLGGDPRQRAAVAQNQVRELRQKAMEQGRSYCFETVMSHPSHIDHMLAASKAGFAVSLFFVATEDPAINIQRVRSRVKSGGHPVPEDRIVARYHKTLALAPDAIFACNTADIFDNSGEGQMLLIAEIQDNFVQFAAEPMPRWFRPIFAKLNRPSSVSM